MTDAERRLAQALYKLNIDWGQGLVDYAGLKAILTGNQPLDGLHRGE